MTPAQLLVKAANSRFALPFKGLARRLRETYYNQAVLYRLESKTKPLPIQVKDNNPVRINLLIPEINFRNFYGGYIAKFNLAQNLVKRGYHVRIITVDQCLFDPETWRREIQSYSGLEDAFDQIEVECCFEREKALQCNPNDTFIATTWWTAYIANAALNDINRGDFIYLIQEYEPFTFAMGSYYAVAHESYQFPHKSLFSSRLLQEYFELHQVGGCSPDSDHSLYFENAILAFDDSEILQRNEHAPKKLLFYARPEAHASRNMFEVAYLALASAIEEGCFDNQNWEFYGIGTHHGDIPLPKNKKLQMLGKVGLKQYRELLLQHDLGLSLMYTPHPSLLPLEMAAAGMRVVTSECLNKTAGKMNKISPNIIAAKPNIEGVKTALAEAVSGISDYDGRRAGARVAWANDWQHAFNEKILQTLDHWLIGSTRP